MKTIFADSDIRRIEQHYVQVWLGLGTLAPEMGLEVERFDTGLALYWSEVPAPIFNRVVGIGRSGSVDRAELDRILGRYLRSGAPWCIQLTPGLKDAGLRADLRMRGLAPLPPSPILGLKPDGWISPRLPNDVLVAEASPLDEDDFAGVLVESFEMPPEIREWIVKLSRAANVTNYLGRIDGKPAGTGMIVEEAGVAGLYSAGVLETFRRRGLHQALIARRVQSAFERGHDLLMSETDAVGNQSYRDLEKQGFATVYLQENWGRE